MLIPVRHPLDVAASWSRRGKPIEKLVRSYDSMFNHLGWPHTLYRIEDIPVLDGGDDSDRMKSEAQWRINDYQAAIVERVVTPNLQFFTDLYPEIMDGEQNGNWNH